AERRVARARDLLRTRARDPRATRCRRGAGAAARPARVPAPGDRRGGARPRARRALGRAPRPAARGGGGGGAHGPLRCGRRRLGLGRMSRTDRGAPPTLEARGGDGSPAAAELAALGPWFHNVHLPGGAQTAPDHPLGDFPRFKWEQIAPCLPSALESWRVLDVGCNAGFYSLELARRGALVTAIDIEDRYLAQADWVLRRWDLRDRVALRRQSVYALARGDERWDLVWFMGVLYHLRHPLLALG